MGASNLIFGRGPAWLHVGTACGVLLLHALDLLPLLFVGDIGRYAAIATGPTFWIGQPVEFPPITAAYIWVTARWGAASLLTLPAANLLLDLGTAVVIGRTWGREAADRYLVLAAPLLLITLFRVDHLAVLLTVLGLAAAHRGRDGRGGALLAMGALAKLWPAAALAGYPLRRARLVMVGAAVGAAGLVLWVLVFGREALEQVVTFRESTGWQIESLPGSILHLVTGQPAVFEGGAWRVEGPPTWAMPALAGAGLVVFGLSRRVSAVTQRQLALVTGLMLVTPLLSPQFLLWLVPLAALLDPGRLQRNVERLLGLAILYTLLLAAYYGYLIDGELLAVTSLLIRNAILVVILVLALVPERATTQGNVEASGSDAPAAEARTST